MHSRRSPRVRRLQLIRQLRTARHALYTWELALRSAAVLAPTRSEKDSLSQTVVLLAILDQAGSRLDQRLAELVGVRNKLPGKSFPSRAIGTRSAEAPGLPRTRWMRAGRACGRALATAFREAQKAADGVTARILYGPMRDLEKELWVLDPHQAH